MRVWIVNEIYQYDGLSGTYVYKSKESAVKMANKLAESLMKAGYEFADWLDEDERHLLVADNITLFGGNYLDSCEGEVRITVELFEVNE